ncbi:MAG: hypothetical protein QM709_05170 [Spongiibacteraceae bacterium]
MRKFLAPAVLIASISGGAIAADLIIPAGQIYTVPVEQSDLRLDRLSIGDNAQVKFAEGVGRWRVAAKHVSIGNNVVIDGRGASASSAVAASGAAMERAKDCEPGAAGKAGAAGASGGGGVNLVFWWGVDSWGSAKFLADGGNGGNGGNGGRGQDGGKVNRCNGPAAGAGGVGGSGGAGGKSGDVTLNYYDANGKGAALKDRLVVSAAGGQPGIGGAGGSGGLGAEGRFQRTATSEAWFPAGQNGVPGAAGSAGIAGAAGNVSIEKVAGDSVPLWFAEAGSLAPADRGTVQSLQKQVQALQAGAQPAATSPDRVQALEERLLKLEERIKALEAR